MNQWKNNTKFVDLSISEESFSEEVAALLVDLFKSDDFILGKTVKEFEKEIAKFIGVNYEAFLN